MCAALKCMWGMLCVCTACVIIRGSLGILRRQEAGKRAADAATGIWLLVFLCFLQPNHRSS